MDMTEHILLIDDDLRLSAMVADYLKGHGYQVATAPSLGAGREALARQNFDALVLDLDAFERFLEAELSEVAGPDTAEVPAP